MANKHKPKKKKRGRPLIKFDLKVVEAFGAVKASYRFMADYFGCELKTIDRRMKKEDEDFCLHYKKGLAKTKFNLAKKQIEIAMAGNVTMLIWLGKQLLEQSDKQEIGKPGDFESTAKVNLKPLKKNARNNNKK